MHQRGQNSSRKRGPPGILNPLGVRGDTLETQGSTRSSAASARAATVLFPTSVRDRGTEHQQEAPQRLASVLSESTCRSPAHVRPSVMLVRRNTVQLIVRAAAAVPSIVVSCAWPR